MNSPDLSGMLADPAESGVYFVAGEGRDTLVEAAQRLAFLVISVDLEGCSDRDTVLARIATSMRFPAWFGSNWDALADCLNDLSWLPADGYVLLLEHVSAWRAAEPDAFRTLLELLAESADRWREQGVALWALLPVRPVAAERPA